MPTIYDVLDITPSKLVDGIGPDLLDGTSMAYTFDSAKAPGHKRSQYFEIMGSRAFHQDDWIASVFGPRIPWKPGVDPAILKWSPDQGTWELHDSRTDYSQAHDVAAEHPDKVDALKAGFATAAEASKVWPAGGGLWSVVFHPEDAPSNPATEFRYIQEAIGVPAFTAPKVGARSNMVTIDTELKPDSQGVLYALGAFSGGVALWVDKGTLNYEYNLLEIERTSIASTAPLPAGKASIEVETRKDGSGRSAPLDVEVRVNGKVVALGRGPRSAPPAFTANDALDVGRDSCSPVSLAYFDRKPFAFNGKIDSLDVKYMK